MRTKSRATLAIALSVFGVACTPAEARAAAHVPHELVVRYRAGTTSAERDQIRDSAGVRSAGLVDGSTQRVKVLDAESIRDAAAKLEADPRVIHAVPNYVAKLT